MENLERILREQPVFAGLDDAHIALICGCTKNVRFTAGEYLFKEGDPADMFYLLREGQVALEVHAPGHGTMQLLTVQAGELVGLSWLVPPYRCALDARVQVPVRALAIHGKCLRDKCEADAQLGYQLMKRFMPVLVERLHATRMQSLDVYGRSAAR